jgi:hypothetical protein
MATRNSKFSVSQYRFPLQSAIAAKNHHLTILCAFFRHEMTRRLPRRIRKFTHPHLIQNLLASSTIPNLYIPLRGQYISPLQLRRLN